jgi:hypothetical protein
MSTSIADPPHPHSSEPGTAIAGAVRRELQVLPVAGQQVQDPAVPWRVARLVLEAAAHAVSAVDGALTRAPARRAAVDVVIGAGAVANEMTVRIASQVADAGRRVTARMPRLPVVEEHLNPVVALSQLAERGRRERAAAAVDLRRLAAALVPAVTAAVLDRLDLTALVRERVELDSLVAGVDVDAVAARVDVDVIAARVDVDTIAARVDVDAIVDRLDLVTIANRVIDGIDLPEIIRESTGTVTGEMVRDVRMRGIEADRAVAGLAARFLRRRPRPPGMGTAMPGLETPP